MSWEDIKVDLVIREASLACPEVVGSNPAPATNNPRPGRMSWPFCRFDRHVNRHCTAKIFSRHEKQVVFGPCLRLCARRPAFYGQAWALPRVERTKPRRKEAMGSGSNAIASSEVSDQPDPPPFFLRATRLRSMHAMRGSIFDRTKQRENSLHHASKPSHIW